MQQQSRGYHFQIARLRWTSSRRSIGLYPSKNGGCSQIIENSQIGMVQTFGYVSHDTNGLNHGPVWKTQSFLLSEICMATLWQDYYGNGNSRKCCWSTVGKKFPIVNACSYTVKKGLFLSVFVDDINLAGKNLDPTWKVLNKEVDLGEPTSFFDHVYLGCTQRQCKISTDIVDNYRTMFESRISAWGTKKFPCTENLHISSWS